MNKFELEKAENEIEALICGIEDESGQCTPIIDGIVDIDSYLNAPVKILWVLKEVNSPGDQDRWSLKDAIRGLRNGKKIQKGWEKTFGPIVYATYGIMNQCRFEDIPHINQQPDLIDGLKQIAYINVKKLPGSRKASFSKLKKYYRAHKSIFLKQVKTYDPDVIICGGTYGVICQDFHEDAPIVKAYHPAQRRLKRAVWCDRIIETAEYILGRK